MASKNAFNQRRHKRKANSPRSFSKFYRANFCTLVINNELQALFSVRELETGFFFTLFLSTALLLGGASTISAQTPPEDRQQNTLTVVFLNDNKTCPIKLDDSKQARAFLKLLPLELSLRDFNGTEKIATLPKKLTLDEEPKGFEPKRGDVTYYIPWGNLAIFYKDFRYSEHLVHLGKLGNCIENFATGNSLSIRIEKD